MENQRTLKQNKALHLYCKMLSEALNNAGISQGVFLRGLEVDNSPESVKAVFREIGKVKYLENSTARLSKKEMTEVFEEINRHIASFGIHIPWPSKENKKETKVF